ncbi:histidinol dehydrogenase [Microbacterium sp. 179-I 3D4 NHS]|uniref:histidinol dehydrogenase n=1 Tax=Microbacterium sp. 179-I 3D4 NHS TaxID=3142381 RepID=UPI00399F5B40
MRVSWVSRIVSWVAVALVGGVYGVAGTIGHSLAWGPVPVGLIVGAIACAAILIAVRALTHDRGAALAAGLGMLGMLVLISGVGPGGSVVVEDTVAGRIWTYLIAGIVLLVVAWPSFRRPEARSETPASDIPPPPLITSVPSAPTWSPHPGGGRADGHGK